MTVQNASVLPVPVGQIDRKTYLGSADIAAIFGCEDAFSSPYGVWSKKMGFTPSNEISEAMRVGIILEAYILDRYGREENAKVGGQQVFYRHPDWDFLGCTIDGLIFDQVGNPLRIVEAKTTRDWSWTEVPLSYEAQVQWQMGVSGIYEADLTVLHRPDLSLKTYRMTFNPSIYAALEERAIDFWFGHVQAGVPPAVDGTASTTEALKSIAADPGKEVAIDNLAQRLEALKQVKSVIQQQEELKDQIENEIRLALGHAETGLIDGQKAVTWKTQKTTRFDSKRFKEEQPETYGQFQVSSESRVLRILKAGK
jgi:putative phage-type endonuclease